LQQVFSDPSVLVEVLQSLNDPDFVAQLEEKLADPNFQEQAREAIAKARMENAPPANALASLLLAVNPVQMRRARSARGASNVKMETNADLRALAQKLNPAVGYFDPLKLGADSEGNSERSEAVIGFLRHAEIKHGRVSMAAFIGYCVTANGFRWPIEPFASVTATSPMEQWDALSPGARWQIILAIGFLEGFGEFRGTGEKHYMRGGKPGYYPPFDEIPKDQTGWYPNLNLWDPQNTMKNMSPEKKEKKLLAELNNGRLAMLGISAFISEARIPGAIPLLKGVVEPYKGDLVFPPGQYGWVTEGLDNMVGPLAMLGITDKVFGPTAQR
jgi:hypothetical protein